MSRRERDDIVPVAARIADSVLRTFLLPEGTGGMGCRQEAVEFPQYPLGLVLRFLEHLYVIQAWERNGWIPISRYSRLASQRLVREKPPLIIQAFHV